MDKYDGFEKVTFSGVYMANEPDESTPIVFLENEGERVLPIFIGAAEAFSIQTALDELPYPRPLTHDLIISILKELQAKLTRIMIDDLSDGVFYARLVISQNDHEIELDARPSDSIALAIRNDADVYVAKDVMKDAAVEKDKYKVG